MEANDIRKIWRVHYLCGWKKRWQMTFKYIHAAAVAALLGAGSAAAAAPVGGIPAVQNALPVAASELALKAETAANAVATPSRQNLAQADSTAANSPALDSTAAISPARDSASVASAEMSVTTAALADMLISDAMELRGTPYRYGSRGPRSFDCSGFTGYIYRKYGYELERSSSGQAGQGREVSGPWSALQKGDILVFASRRNTKRVGHVGLFIEMSADGKDFTFIHAAVRGGVVVSHITEEYYASRFLGARRILPDFVKAPSDTLAQPLPDGALLDARDTLTLAAGDVRLLLLADGRWMLIGEDGVLHTPADSVNYVLHGSGQWSRVVHSTHRIPSREGAGAQNGASGQTATAAGQGQSASAKSAAGQTSDAGASAAKASAATAAQGGGTSSEAVYHTVKSGDTLSSIALRNKTTVEALCRLNGISKKAVLRIGKRIRVK